MDRQQQIQQLRRRIAGLVREIVLLSESRIPPGEFFKQFLLRVMRAMEAVGGGVWYVGTGGRLQLAAATNLDRINFQVYLRPPESGTETTESPPSTTEEDETDKLPPGLRRFVGRALLPILKQGKPAVLGPQTEGEEGNHPPLLLAPIVVEGRSAGVLLAAPRPGTDPRALRGMLSFMNEVCRQASRYLQQQRLRALASLQQHSQNIIALLEQAHASLDPVRVAFALANMGQTMVGCDRLSVALVEGGRGRVVAVSGHDVIHRRSALIKRLGKLAAKVCRWGGTLRQPTPPEADPPPPSVGRALEEYSALTNLRSLIAMPVKHEGQTLGALVAESKSAEALGPEHVARLLQVARHGGPALANALRYHRLPLLRALGAVRWLFERALGGTALRAIKRLTLLAAPILVLTLLPWDLTVRAPLIARPELVRIAYAQTEGTIREVLVREGERVEAGQVLAKMEDATLKAKLEANKAQLAVEEAKLLELSDSEDPSRAEIQRHVVALHRAWVEYQQRELDRTRVLAPISGIVLTQHPEDLQQKPVKVGDPLFRIADVDGNWYLEIELPERDAGYVLSAAEQLRKGEGLEVSFYLSAFPRRRFRTHVRRISSQAEVIRQRNVVRVIADVPPEARKLVKAQMRGEARIHCGRRPLGYVLFRGVIDFVRTHLTF